MRALALIFFVAASALLTPSVGNAQPAPAQDEANAQPAPAQDEANARLSAFCEGFALTVVTHAKDCGVMTQKLQARFDAEHDFLKGKIGQAESLYPSANEHCKAAFARPGVNEALEGCIKGHPPLLEVLRDLFELSQAPSVKVAPPPPEIPKPIEALTEDEARIARFCVELSDVVMTPERPCADMGEQLQRITQREAAFLEGKIGEQNKKRYPDAFLICKERFESQRFSIPLSKCIRDPNVSKAVQALSPKQ